MGIITRYFGKSAAIESFKVPEIKFRKIPFNATFKSLPTKHSEKGKGKGTIRDF